MKRIIPMCYRQSHTFLIDFQHIRFVPASKDDGYHPCTDCNCFEYNWTVVPTEIEDRTKITIETTFETFVPVPVVTIDPPFIDMADHPLASQQILLTIKNSGLIAAQGAKLQFSDHPWYKITPLVEDVGLVPALGEIKVPVTIENHAPAGGGGGVALAGGGSRSQARPAGVPCTISAGLEWFLICGPDRKYHRVPLPVLNVHGDCGSLGFRRLGRVGRPRWRQRPCRRRCFRTHRRLRPAGQLRSVRPGHVREAGHPDRRHFELLRADRRGGRGRHYSADGRLVAAERGHQRERRGATCCCRRQSGHRVYGHAGASLEVAVGPGISKDASITVDVPPKGEASLSGEIKLGLQATGSLSFDGEVSSGCDFSGLEVTASGQVALRFSGASWAN